MTLPDSRSPKQRIRKLGLEVIRWRGARRARFLRLFTDAPRTISICSQELSGGLCMRWEASLRDELLSCLAGSLMEKDSKPVDRIVVDSDR
jgi:hypothetical protein